MLLRAQSTMIDTPRAPIHVANLGMSPTSIGPRDERAAEQVGIGGGGAARAGTAARIRATKQLDAPWYRLRPPLPTQRPRHTPGKPRVLTSQ
jgi:hypothetical protein